MLVGRSVKPALYGEIPAKRAGRDVSPDGGIVYHGTVDPSQGQENRGQRLMTTKAGPALAGVLSAMRLGLAPARTLTVNEVQVLDSSEHTAFDPHLALPDEETGTGR
jgi:hypothetical protein